MILRGQGIIGRCGGIAPSLAAFIVSEAAFIVSAAVSAINALSTSDNLLRQVQRRVIYPLMKDFLDCDLLIFSNLSVSFSKILTNFSKSLPNDIAADVFAVTCARTANRPKGKISHSIKSCYTNSRGITDTIHSLCNPFNKQSTAYSHPIIF